MFRKTNEDGKKQKFLSSVFLYFDARYTGSVYKILTHRHIEIGQLYFK